MISYYRPKVEKFPVNHNKKWVFFFLSFPASLFKATQIYPAAPLREGLMLGTTATSKTIDYI